MSEADLGNYFLQKKLPYIKPLYSINLSNKDDVLTWFREANFALGEYYRPLFTEQKNNLAFFLGSSVAPNFDSPFSAAYAATTDLYNSEANQIYINEMFRLVMSQVTLVVSNELVPEVLPNSEDYSDKVACNVTKDWLDSMNYDMETDAWRLRWEMQKKIFGESFCIVNWNPNSGDLHPDAREFIKEDLDLLDEEGHPIVDSEGKKLPLKKGTRIGDLDFINPMPWNVFIDPQPRYKDSNWFFWKEFIDVEYLKKRFPKLNWDNPNENKQYDLSSNTEKDDENRRCIYYLFHRSHEFMPEGRFIVCSAEHELVNQPLDMPTILNNQTLPLIRFFDLDIGVGVRGIPILFRNCKNVSDAENKVTNQIYNNLEMESPKIFVHEDAGVDAQRMPNGTQVFEWRGNIKPTIETPATNTTGIFNFRDSLKKNLDELALQTPMVRGDTPNAQLDSFIALQHFEDQRVQLAAPDIKGHIRSMEQLYRLMITIAKDKYHPDDGRLIKILGKHNTYQLRYFDPTNLQKAYDVKISTTGNLANSKAARNQMLLSIKREFPAIITDEVFLDMIGLSHSKKFMNAITAAVSSAEAENQSMFDGEEMLSPTRYEDLISHWETHRIPLQTLDFKQSPPEVQELFIRHVTATEKLMFEQAAESPTFQSRLEALRQFPMFYTPVPVNEVIPPPGSDQLALPDPSITEQLPVA